QAAEIGVVHIACRILAPFALEREHTRRIATLSRLVNAVFKPPIFRVSGTCYSARVVRDEDVLNELVQRVKVDIAEQWAEYPTLRCTAVGGLVLPVLHHAGRQVQAD